VWIAGSTAFLLHITLNSDVRARPLKDWAIVQQDGGKVVLAFYDPCHLATNPGWPLRNLLALASVRWDVTRVQVLCYRERRGQVDLEHCPVFDVALPSLPGLLYCDEAFCHLTYLCDFDHCSNY
jgi:ubiquitin-like modifier-activating enzyme ATG7